MDKKTLYRYLRLIMKNCQSRRCEFGVLLNKLVDEPDSYTTAVTSYINRIVNYYNLEPKNIDTLEQFLYAIVTSEHYKNMVDLNAKDDIQFTRDGNIYYMIYRSSNNVSRFDNYVLSE